MRITLSLLLLSLFFLSGCQEIRDVGAVVVVKTEEPEPTPTGRSPAKPPAHAPAHGQRAKKGPPPHAPAHGYRHRQDNGMELVFDSGLGVYVVVNHSDVYFHNSFYLRFFNDRWVMSAHFDGPWEDARENQVPPKLKKSKPKKGKKKGRY